MTARRVFGHSRFRLSGQSQLAPDDARDETAAGAGAVDERADASLDRVTHPGVSCSPDRVRVGRPHVGAPDLVAMPLDKPPKGHEASLSGKLRVRLSKVSGGACQRLGIARRPVGERNRLIEEPGILVVQATPRESLHRPARRP